MDTAPERDVDALVARDEELAFLRQTIGDARAGRGRLVLVQGAPGSGRTRLVREAASMARDRGMRVVWLPNEGDGASALIDEALRVAAPPGLVLVADDGNAIDAVRLRRLTSIAGDLRRMPVLALVTLTTPTNPREPAGWAVQAERTALHLRLRPFRPGTVIALAARMGAVTTIAMLERLHAATGGNPLLVIDTLAELRRTDAVDDGGPWPLSERASRWTRARLDALPPEARAAVEVASVLGEECDVGLLAQAMQWTADPEELRAPVDRTGFLLMPSGRTCCRFVPPLARDLVYATLSAARRRVLHAHVATILGTNGSMSPVVLAHRGLAALAADDVRGCQHQLKRLAEPQASPTMAASPTGWPYFVREAEGWAIGYGARAVRLHDRAGLRYVARLLSRPCVEFTALALAERPRGRNEVDASEPAMVAERARVRVTRRIRDAIERIAHVHPELGTHLERTIHTGARCAYVVDPTSVPSWEVRWTT